ncbi:hypothetical protein MMC19_005150 [Ptychographa xylographoides]|nr:hypothetical protein [Ptychographa xylographoides]
MDFTTAVLTRILVLNPKMGRFGKGKSDRWHFQIDATSYGQRIFNDDYTLSSSFPWRQLKLHTETYLAAKGKLSTQERDQRIFALVRSHNDKDLAFAACARAMSSQGARDLMEALDITPGIYIGFASYLKHIIVANHENDSIASEMDALRALALIRFGTTPDTISTGRYLVMIINLWMTGIPADSLLYVHIHTLAYQSSRDFATRMEHMRRESQWGSAQVAATWLLMLTGSPLEVLGDIVEQERFSPLDSVFRSWRTWAAWRPSADRLHLWERLNREQRTALHDLLALEGPDFTAGGGEGTLREGLIAQVSKTSCLTIRSGDLIIQLTKGIAAEAQGLIDRMLGTLDLCCQLKTVDTTLVTDLCEGKIVNDETLRLLNGITYLGVPSTNALVLQVYRKRLANSDDTITAIMRLLPVLNTPMGARLRDVLAPSLLECITHSLEAMEKKLRTQMLSSEPWDGTELKLQAFGQILQESSWLRPLLDPSLWTRLCDWPAEKEIKALKTLRDTVRNTTTEIITISSNLAPLSDKIDSYCMSRLTLIDAFDETGTRLMGALVSLWQQTPDTYRLTIALIMAQDSGFDLTHRCRCVEQLPNLPKDFVLRLWQMITQNSTMSSDLSYVNFTRSLASMPVPEVIDCWRLVLYHLIGKRGLTIIDYTSSLKTTQSKVSWLNDLGFIFSDMITAWLPGSWPAVLKPTLIGWAKRLNGYLPTIARLETSIGYVPATQSFLMGYEEPVNESLGQILDLLVMYDLGRCGPVMQKVTAHLRQDGSNAKEIYVCLSTLTTATSEGLEACLRVMELHGNPNTYMAEIVLAGLVQSSDTTLPDLRSFRTLGVALALQLDSTGNPLPKSLDAAADYLDTQVAQLLAEASRLDNLRLAAKALDPEGISRLLARLEIESPSLLADELARLPTALIDVVERVGEQEVELQVPLTHLTPLQRISMGVGTAQSLLVRLIVGDQGMAPGFCMHFDNETQPVDMLDDHSHWLVYEDSSAPDKHICRGQANRTTYQLARTLWRNLKAGFKSVEDTYTLIVATLKDLAQNCMICGSPHGARLQRSTICQSPDCVKTAIGTTIDIRLADIRHDPAAMDLLLLAVDAVVLTGKLDLLPGCPIPGKSKIEKQLCSMPTVSKLQHTPDLDAAFSKADFVGETLLTWICNSYRGFVASASGPLKIPSLPGAHQFLLANAGPDLESAFAAQVAMTAAPPRALFHGTSLDRLYAILAQGLRVCSGTALQRHGAAHGAGIYMAAEPATAWSYATSVSAASAGASASSTGWKNSAMKKNARVLLGCEFAGSASTSSSSGIHVVTNPSQLMVRYIFLMPPGTATPLAAHITPAMLSVFASLRSGTA